MSFLLSLAGVLYIVALVLGAIASYYPEIQHFTIETTTPLNFSSSNTRDAHSIFGELKDNSVLTVKGNYKYGPFRACQNADMYLNQSLIMSTNEQCSYINTDCAAHFDETDAQFSGLHFDATNGNITANSTSLILPQCTRFNVMRGTLVSGVVFSGFSILAVLYILCKVQRAGDPYLVRSSGSKFICNTLFFSSITLGFFVTAFALAYLQNAYYSFGDDVKDYYEDLRSFGFSLWFMTANVGITTIALLLWFISLCCLGGSSRRREPTSSTPFIASRSRARRPNHQSHTAASPYV